MTGSICGPRSVPSSPASSATRRCCGMATAASPASRSAIGGRRARPARACFVKFGAVGPGAEDRFAALLDACAELAVAAGMTTVLAGVNLVREEAYRAMLRRGFRTQIQGVT